MARPQPRPLATAVLLLLVLLVPVEAQLFESAEAVHRTVVRFYPFGGGDHDNLFVRQPGRPERVEALQLTPGRRSPAIEYAGPEKLILWRADEAAGAAKKQFRPLGTVVLPPARETLVLVIANPRANHSDEPAFHLFAMDDGRIAVPENHLAFFNLTGVRLTAWIGDRELQLDAGLSRAVDLRPFLGAQDVLVALTLLQGGEERIVLENRTRFIGDRRTLIVLLPPPTPESTEVRAFRIDDRVLPSEGD